MTDEMAKISSLPVPELTLDPLAAEAPAAPILQAEPAQSPAAAPSLEDMLSEEERAQVDAFAGQIDLADSQLVLTYGAGAQKKMADFSETALDRVRTQDLGEAGDLIASVVTELKSFDADEEKGLFGFFKRQADKVTALKARYDKAQANVD